MEKAVIVIECEDINMLRIFADKIEELKGKLQSKDTSYHNIDLTYMEGKK